MSNIALRAWLPGAVCGPGCPVLYVVLWQKKSFVRQLFARFTQRIVHFCIVTLYAVAPSCKEHSLRR